VKEEGRREEAGDEGVGSRRKAVRLNALSAEGEEKKKKGNVFAKKAKEVGIPKSR